ncbi:MAG TPA: DUF448 domain-containing protein [Acetobacteraceae bacterium]|nr:DUF448 domain-containing protein [Acetobacteraceae bacterium]
MASVLGLAGRLQSPPFRRCVLTREVLPKDQMVRLVVRPDEAGSGRILVPDLAGCLPGRGIWLSARGDVIETARVRGTLQRAIARIAGGSVAIPADLRDRLAAGLERRIADFHARAERAGQAVAACARLNDLVRTDIGRLAGLRSAQTDGAPMDGRARNGADGALKRDGRRWTHQRSRSRGNMVTGSGERESTQPAPANEGTNGRVHDGRQ